MESSEKILTNAKLFIVDDEPANVRYLEVTLQRAGYVNIQTTTDSREVIPRYIEMQPDILLLDLNMPYIDGFTIMEELTAMVPPETYLPILVLTADVTAQTKRRALSQGAKDFLTKPLDITEVLLRVNNLLETRFQNQILEARVQERTRALESAQRETLQRLALAAEYRDDDTGQHTKRVGLRAARIAEVMGLRASEIELLQQTAPLHDVGKIGIPDAILLKPGKLEDAEFAEMKTHTVTGGKILSGSSSPWLQMAEAIALSHHERWDGRGYPAGLKGEDIPLIGRIVAVADVYDALTSERPYKKAWSHEQALAEIVRMSGQQFDPAVVDAFVEMLRTMDESNLNGAPEA